MSCCQNNDLPCVSVIVPAYNAEESLSKLLESLLNQNYPRSLTEIIVVDNNSKDNTKNIAKQYPVKLLEENNTQGSYAARNRGIKEAKGNIIAFIDSDCIATPNWIREGVQLLISESADLVGGKVEFTYSKRKTAAELYDSITNMQIESNIKKRKIAKTANLFVKAFLFGKVGLFPSWVVSGGDIQWTAKATNDRYSLTYSPRAIVKHPARNLKGLLKKQYRVGKGKIQAWYSEGKPSWRISFIFLKLFLPLRFCIIKEMIKQNETTEMNNKFISIWCVSYLCNIFTAFGILVSVFSNLIKKREI